MSGQNEAVGMSATFPLRPAAASQRLWAEGASLIVPELGLLSIFDNADCCPGWLMFAGVNGCR